MGQEAWWLRVLAVEINEVLDLMRLRSWQWGRHVYWIPSMWHSLWCSRCASLIGRLGFWFTALVLTLWVWIWPCKLICIKLPKWASITLQTWDQVYSLMNEEVQPEKIQSKLKKKTHPNLKRAICTTYTANSHLHRDNHCTHWLSWHSSKPIQTGNKD